ncbi:MAG: hypothetical protein KatS3mg111_1327 [Pirellulaceae bacterium]|nr:MAG: hypothetical protein KatS3mg111_1327 [Pirellulaceae bacterium]
MSSRLTIPSRLADVEEKLLAQWPTERWEKVRVVVAVSGGADSVALLRALLRLSAEPRRLLVAHFNHRWRGTASDEDAAWVERLAARWGLCCQIGTMPGEPVPASEQAARDARYCFLRQVAHRFGARYVATAHTADDRIETFFHNMLRGSGVRGLASLQPFRSLDEDLVLARPLLSVERTEIESYLAALDQSYRHDQTNEDPSFARNYLRHAILPALRQRYGEHTFGRLTHLLDDLAEWRDCIDHVARDYLAEVRRLATSAPFRTDLERLTARVGASPLRPALPPNHPSSAERWPPWGVAIPDKSSLPAGWIVVREALRWQWEIRGWPLGQMSRERWHDLRSAWEIATEPVAAVRQLASLPGGLRLLRSAHWIAIAPAEIASGDDERNEDSSGISPSGG